MVRRNTFARNCPKLLLLFNDVANPPYCFNESGASGRFVQLLPQPPDVGHDGVVVLQVLLTPNRFKQFLGGDNHALPFTEIPERELKGCQLQFLPKQEALVAVPIDDQPRMSYSWADFSGFGAELL